MMLPRVYLPGVTPGDDEIVLPDDEAHHLVRVLRVGPGDEIRVFDGRGQEYHAHVASATRQAVRVRLGGPVPGVRLPRVALTVVASILKSDAMDDVVRDCTMVGVATIQPVLSARSTVKAAHAARGRDRWQRVALAAARQCGRSTLPEIADPVSFAEWLRTEPAGLRLLLVEPAAAAGALTLRDLLQREVPNVAAVVVGPEGGWSPSERDMALAAGCVPLTLGPLTLRAHAVPLAAAAALVALWEE